LVDSYSIGIPGRLRRDIVAKVSVGKMWHSRGGGLVKSPGRAGCLAALILAILWVTPGCPPPPGSEKLKKEVEALKAEVTTLKEKVDKLEATQKILVEMVKTKTAAPIPAAPGAAAELPGLPPPPAQASAAPLTVDELFKNKDHLIGTRVTVRGIPGPVLMHKKTLFLSGPEGMVEVIYGNIQDKKQVDRITAQNIETPITVSGLLSAAPGQAKGQVRLIIMADSVEF
jgi:hypothetical protein